MIHKILSLCMHVTLGSMSDSQVLQFSTQIGIENITTNIRGRDHTKKKTQTCVAYLVEEETFLILVQYFKECNCRS